MKKRDYTLQTFLKITLICNYSRGWETAAHLKSKYYIRVLARRSGNNICKQLNSQIKPKVSVTQICELKVSEDIIFNHGQVANEFNDFFRQSVKDLAISFRHISSKMNVMALNKDEVNSVQFREIDQSVLLKAIEDLNTTFYGIPQKI